MKQAAPQHAAVVHVGCVVVSAEARSAPGAYRQATRRSREQPPQTCPPGPLVRGQQRPQPAAPPAPHGAPEWAAGRPGERTAHDLWKLNVRKPCRCWSGHGWERTDGDAPRDVCPKSSAVTDLACHPTDRAPAGGDSHGPCDRRRSSCSTWPGKCSRHAHDRRRGS